MYSWGNWSSEMTTTSRGRSAASDATLQASVRATISARGSVLIKSPPGEKVRMSSLTKECRTRATRPYVDERVPDACYASLRLYERVPDACYASLRDATTADVRDDRCAASSA